VTFSPPRVAISSITQANPCVVTTSSNHSLITGRIVRIHVPKNFGMTPLNNGLFSVTVLSPTTFSLQISQIPPAINVDSTKFPAFVIPSNPQLTAEVLYVGSGPTPITNTPAQVLSNFCDDITDNASENVATVNQPF
jgi:hypothetical protein